MGKWGQVYFPKQTNVPSISSLELLCQKYGITQQPYNILPIVVECLDGKISAAGVALLED